MKGVRNWILMMLLLCICGSAQAQVKVDRLVQFSEQLAVEREARKARIAQFLAENQGKGVISLGENRKGYIQDVINGKPVYVAELNNDAAENVGSLALRAGGALGLNLSGVGMRVHVWDSPGGARLSHQEFADRLTRGDFASEAASNHSTHITGTILAGGADPAARGMAPSAHATVFDFNDDLSEMTQVILDDPNAMILSNHSYGLQLGWEFDGANWSWFGDADVDPAEDWRFGFYGTNARGYDELMYDNPNYLILFAAGNDRSDVGEGPQPADGPYDVIGSYSTNKNGVTVGANRKLLDGYNGPEDVVISTFTSFGPTDDGRIKPDISAPGVSVYSPIGSGDDSYASFQGTSTSTPVVTGSLALIQELSLKMRAQLLTSAQLKAVMIHNAYEAGDADGPDYEFGWGMLNTEAMANFLLKENDDNLDLITGALAEGATDSYTITPMQGTKVKLTLVWTDLPGVVPAQGLDPENLILINDLDMRAVGATETQEPWILNPATPAQPATKGDNFRDNVEKVEFTAVDASYTVNINHKGTLGETDQVYALVIEYEKENASKTMYWVGNSGAWNDGANWSLTSGGTSAGMVPAANDFVIFDNNSFTGLANEDAFAITLSQNTEIAQFRWFAEKQGTFDLGGNTLTSGGDVVVLSDQVNLNNGTLSLSKENGGAVVNIQATVPGSDIVIDSKGDAAFQIVGNFEGKSLKLMKGTLNISQSNLKLGTMTVAGGVLNISNSSLALTSGFAIEDETADINWTDTEVTVADGATVTLNLAGAIVPMSLTVAGSATITSGAEIQSLTNTGTTSVNTDLRLTDISLAAGSTLNIGDGNTVTIAGMFDTSGIDGSLVALASAGTAQMDIENHRKICTDFISVTGVNQVGQATVSVGTNSQLAGSETGWQQRACDDILFADFNFSYGCVNGLTQFENLSSGDVQSSAWNFGESDPATVDSEEANPTYSYTTAGAKSIKLTVTDSENNAFELTANTEIIDNTIGGFDIVEQVGFLVSQRQGESYQWYKDGQPIAGETTRQLQATDAGVYNILVFDGACNRFSTDFELTVTSIEPDPEEQEKVEEAVNIFPNPTRDYIDVTIQGYNLRSLAMELVDQSGKVVTTSNHQNINRDSFSERLKVADKRQGFYILRFVVNENIIINRKVILTD